jgi:molybdate transport system permease protein
MTEPWLGLGAEDWRAVWVSLQVSTAALCVSLPPGIALGWLLARKNFHGKALVETLVNLPLVLPPVVTGLLLLYLLGRRGLIGSRLLEWFGWEFAFTWKAAVLAAAVMGFPLLVRAVRLSFASIDPRLHSAARSLGAGPWDAFFTVSLPLARTGVLAGAVLAFARGLGEFGATLIFASTLPQTRTMALQVYVLSNQPGDEGELRMWRLVVVAVAVAFAALVGSEYLERRARAHESA